MTNNRTNYLYKFTGKTLKKRLAQSSPASKYAGQPYYVLTILQVDQTKKSLQVFPSKLANSQIWKAIEQGNCFGSQYDFYCRNQKGYYYLIDWEKKAKSPEPQANDYDLN